jgi:hypothetical protein
MYFTNVTAGHITQAGGPQVGDPCKTNFNKAGITSAAYHTQIRFVVLPSSAYLFTVGVKGFYFQLITLRHTPQSAGLIWTRDQPVAETST